MIFYEAYAKSIINFGVLIYGCTYRSYVQDFSNIQKPIVRAIVFIKKFQFCIKFSLRTRSLQYWNYTFQRLSVSYSKESETAVRIMFI